MKEIIIPKEFMGIPVSEETMKEVLGGSIKEAKTSFKKTKAEPNASGNVNDPDQWMLLEGRQHDNYSYNDLLVSMHRLGYNSEVEKAAKEIGIQVKNTSEEKDKTPYIGNINWEEAIKLNLTLGNITLSPRQGMDLMLDLRKAIKGSKKIYDGKGNEIDTPKLKIVYNEIWAKRDPWRGEWLDAKFRTSGGDLGMLSLHAISGNKIVPHYVMALEDHVREDSYVSLTRINNQGLPTVANENVTPLFFYYPKIEAVAWFVADSDRADLSCDRVPSGRYDGLGVRAVREKN